MNVALGSSPKLFYQFPSHTHSCWEILLCVSGTGVATIDGQDYPFREGTIFCIPPGIPHCKRAEGGYSDSSIFTSEFTPPDSRPIPVYQDDADGTFQQLYNAALRVRLRKDPNAAEIINAIADALYQLLVGWSATPAPRSEAAEAFEQLLMENISNHAFDLTAAIAATGYSQSYFRKLFKAATGMAPLAYFNRMRVEYAKTLLRQSDGLRPIKDIASSAGFSDPYYFSRVFKQYTGRSPAAYLRQPFDRSLIAGMPEYRMGGENVNKP